jgi:hypothetical protein
MDRIIKSALQHRIVVGVFLFALGLGASVWLAFAASSGSPPDGAQSAVLVMVGGLFNLGGAWAVSRRPGGPNLTATRMAARHLAAITTGVGVVKGLAEKAFERRPPGKGREDIGELSWKLSDVETRLISNLEDWTRAYPDLIENEPSNATDGEPERQ